MKKKHGYKFINELNSFTDKVGFMTHVDNSESYHKKIGFVVDLNISRVLSTCVNFNIYNKNHSVNEKIKYLIINRLINIDVDMMYNKKINSDLIIKKLMDIWKNDPINSF
jgi:hypothetical protein